MTRLLAVLVLAGLVLAACGSTGGSIESLAPLSSDSVPSLETSPELSPEFSPDLMSPAASPS